MFDSLNLIFIIAVFIIVFILYFPYMHIDKKFKAFKKRLDRLEKNGTYKKR